MMKDVITRETSFTSHLIYPEATIVNDSNDSTGQHFARTWGTLIRLETLLISSYFRVILSMSKSSS